MSRAAATGETLNVSVQAFVVVLALAAAVLALWVDARFPRLGGGAWQRVFVHLLAALLFIHLVMPGLANAVLASGAPAAFALTAIGITLPAITYLFLSSVWLLKLAQRALAGPR